MQACIDQARADGRGALVLVTTGLFRDAVRLYLRLGFRRARDRDVRLDSGLVLRVYELPAAAGRMTGAIPAGAASHAHVVPRPAATVVLFRDAPDGGEPELLLTRRPSTMAFGPDLHVFPGGAVEPADADAAQGEDPWHVARIAGARELREEAGIALDPAALIPLSHWTTPPIMPRRFTTRFFAAWLPPDAQPRFDPREVVDHAWLAPTAALDAMADGLIDLWIPTSSTLQQLEGVRRPDDIAPRFAAQVDPGRPRYAREDGTLARIEANGAGGVAAGLPSAGSSGASGRCSSTTATRPRKPRTSSSRRSWTAAPTSRPSR